MMHKLIICLAFCSLLGGNQQIGASRVFDAPSRLLGITFSAPESSGEERRQISENELRRAMFQTDTNFETSRYSQATKEELQRRARLNRILDAIGASLAPVSIQPSGQQHVGEASVAASHAPLHRSGRIYPSREINDNLRPPFRSGTPVSEYQGAARVDSLEQWEPSMLDGASSSAKSQRSSTIKGLVWPNGLAIASAGSPPLYSSLNLGSMQPRQHANGGGGGGGGDGGPQPSNIYGANQQRARSGQLIAGSTTQPQHHRLSNSEEVAIQTPVHSRSSSDYEWKRVEQSRWNNLRGMWGKRSAMRDDEDPVEKYKELIEWEAQREAAERAGEPGQDADEPTSASRAKLLENSKQQQQSISSM